MKMNKLFTRLTGVLPVVAMVLLAMPSQAAFVAGTLDFSGEGVVVGNFGIDWLPNPLPNALAPPTTDGTFQYQGPNKTQSFAGVMTVGILGSIRDLPSALGSGAVNLPNFLAFNAPYGFSLNSANFQLDELFQGNLAPGNPIQLTQLGSNVSASVGGRGRILLGADTSNFAVTFTTQFANMTIAQVVAAATSTGIQSSWSGTLTAQAPEPSTYLMMAAGFGMLALVRRRTK